MVNTNALKGKIVERGLTVTDVAKSTGISVAGLYRKLSNYGDTMLIRDAFAIGKFLQLSAAEMNTIFFASEVSNMRLPTKEETKN